MTRYQCNKLYLFDFCFVSVGLYVKHLEVVVSVTYLSPKKINYQLGLLICFTQPVGAYLTIYLSNIFFINIFLKYLSK